MAEPYRGILGPVLGQVEAIKSARSNRAMDELQAKYLQQGFEARQQESQAAGAAGQAEADVQYLANIWGAVAQSDDIETASQRLIKGNPKFLEISQRHGFGDFSDDRGMTPEQKRSIALDNWRAFGGAPPKQAAGAEGVQSTFVGRNGNQWVTMRDGSVKDTGVPVSQFAMRPIETAQGIQAFQPATGQVGAVISPAQDISAMEASRAGQVQGAKETATTAEVPARVTAETRNKRLATQIDEGFAASDAMPIIKRSLDLLGTVKTGGIHAAQLAASNLLGVTGADEAELSQNLGKAVLAQLRTTFGAAFTEREGARLERIEAEFGKSTEANVRLLEQLQKMVEREALRGINAAIQMGDQQTADQIREGLNFSLGPPGGGAPAAAAQGAEPTATGPNGEKLILRNGQWVLMNAAAR